MDPSLFQFNVEGMLNPPKSFGKCDVHAAMRSARHRNRKRFLRMREAILFGLDRVAVKINRFLGTLFILQALLLLVFSIVANPAFAQSLASRGGQPSAQPQASVEIDQRLRYVDERIAGSIQESQASESRIGPDDLLVITIFEAPELNTTVRVSASGEISLQLLGAVHAAGLTPRELESVLQGLLRRSYMKDPHVGVFIQELQSHPVSVVGAVRMPGVFQIRGTKTVIEVLSMAQGLADDAGDTVLIMHGAGYAESGRLNGPEAGRTGVAPVRPREGEIFAKYDASQAAAPEKIAEIEVINLKKLLESADSALNAPVRPGDIVKVTRAALVYVVGEVQKPGGFVLQNNESISVLQALALAQGATHTSALSHARIIRTELSTGKRTEIPMNLGKILSGKAPDTYLQPKDIVFVPNSAAKNLLYRGSEAALQTATGVAIYRW